MKRFIVGVGTVCALLALGLTNSVIYEKELAEKDTKIDELNGLVEKQSKQINTYESNISELNNKNYDKDNEIVELKKMLEVEKADTRGLNPP